MPGELSTMILPLLTLGLPARVSGWLLDAGLPIAPIETAALRRGIVSQGQGRSLVLYDSRNASARIDAEAAESLGYQTIDAARLLVTRRAEDDPELTVVPATDPRRRFFDGLRPAIEEAGGQWIRLADFPFPYRWAVCEDSSPADELDDATADASIASIRSAFAELPAGHAFGGHPSGGRVSAVDWTRTCAATGRPVRVDGDPLAVLMRCGRNTGDAPLTWTTTMDEFVAWWRLRRRLSLKVFRHGRESELELVVPGGVPQAERLVAVEIWRGRHAAVVPIRPGRTMLGDAALPFQLNPSRHPAGFTADATDVEPAGPSLRLAAAALQGVAAG